MAGYKRNQVEEAIARVLGRRSPDPTHELWTRVKRLLETDRSLGRTPGANDPARANYAFYSDDAPGSGIDVRFTGYEAFALLTTLTLMTHGWPQGTAVTILRRVRNDLEAQHARTLKQDKSKLFDQEAIKSEARPGDMALSNTDPVFLTIVSNAGIGSGQRSEPIACAVCHGKEKTFKFVQKVGDGRNPYTLLEIVTTAHTLNHFLEQTVPSGRGRGA